MSEGQASQIGEPCAKQDANKDCCSPAMRNRDKPVKPPAKKVAKSNR